MALASFTRDNFHKTVKSIKTQTRRIGKPRYKVGQVLGLREPTQVLALTVYSYELCDRDGVNMSQNPNGVSLT